MYVVQIGKYKYESRGGMILSFGRRDAEGDAKAAAAAAAAAGSEVEAAIEAEVARRMEVGFSGGLVSFIFHKYFG